LPEVVVVQVVIRRAAVVQVVEQLVEMELELVGQQEMAVVEVRRQVVQREQFAVDHPLEV
jgi:hypothetical protein